MTLSSNDPNLSADDRARGQLTQRFLQCLSLLNKTAPENLPYHVDEAPGKPTEIRVGLDSAKKPEHRGETAFVRIESASLMTLRLPDGLKVEVKHNPLTAHHVDQAVEFIESVAKSNGAVEIPTEETAIKVAAKVLAPIRRIVRGFKKSP